MNDTKWTLKFINNNDCRKTGQEAKKERREGLE